MRYSDMRDMVHERAGLLDKKRLGKNQKARLAALSVLLDEAERYHHNTPATPPCVNTGNRGDYQGNVYLQHKQGYLGLREMRRRRTTGQIQPMRSRIQRSKRKRRTGGAK